MNGGHVISVQANLCAAQLKPQRGGRNQNQMPPEVAAAIKKAEAGKSGDGNAPSAAYPVAQ
ncbi:hypothetical protein [Ferrigenium sp. UT5]|uniref:hypothetical protein n=1 Tax=Ferrigenium sp. UT5 TaxID=3242105 RepID=UPI003552D790